MVLYKIYYDDLDIEWEDEIIIEANSEEDAIEAIPEIASQKGWNPGHCYIEKIKDNLQSATDNSD